MVIHDMYKIDETLADVEMIYYGQWNSTNSIIKIPETNIWKRRSNLKKHRLRLNHPANYSNQIFLLLWKFVCGTSNKIFDCRDRKLFEYHCYLRIASMIYRPQSPYVVDGCTTPDCFVGYYPDIVYNLQRLMNFTYVIKFESVFGKLLQNGTWTGEIGIFIVNMLH